jgi:hypothetical protein
MKTPRGLLLARHRLAESRLESLTAEDLAEQARAGAGAASRSNRPRPSLAARFWGEAIQPWGRLWIGLAAVWVVIAGFSLATPLTAEVAVNSSFPPDPQVRELLREQRELMAQLLQPSVQPAGPVEKAPGPRGERRPPVRFGWLDREASLEMAVHPGGQINASRSPAGMPAVPEGAGLRPCEPISSPTLSA